MVILGQLFGVDSKMHVSNSTNYKQLLQFILKG